MNASLELIYKGALLGMITALSFGPVFFSIIETSIARGHRLAVSIATGVLVSDALIITASFMSIGKLMNDETVSSFAGVTGGVLLLFFGLYYVWKPVTSPKAIQITGAARFSHLLFFLKGLAINTFNPFVLLYWISAVSLVSVDKEMSKAEMFIFFTAAIGCNFFFDLLKTFLAGKLKHLLTPRSMNFISKAVGIGIIYFGMRLLWKTLYN